MVKLRHIYRVDEIVIYDDKKTTIQNFNGDGTCNIINPDYDYDLEKECHLNDIEYDIPYRLTVRISELTPIE